MPADAKGAEHLRDWVGLRPGRTAVRVERERVRGKKGRGKEVEVSHGYTTGRWVRGYFYPEMEVRCNGR